MTQPNTSKCDHDWQPSCNKLEGVPERYAGAMPAKILSEYQRREHDSSARRALAQKHATRYLAGFAAATLLTAVLLVTALCFATSAWPAAAAGVVTVSLLPRWLAARRRVSSEQRKAGFYRECLERASGRKPQTGRTGESFALGSSRKPVMASDSSASEAPRAGELFAKDLDVFGPNSLFGMLATTRTGWGEQALATMLLTDTGVAEMQARQTAVRELMPRMDLREAVALLGESTFEALPEDGIAAWLSLAEPHFPSWLRPVLGAITLAWLAVLLAGLALHWPAGLLWQNLLVLWCLQAGLCWRFRPAVLGELEAAKRLAATLPLLREGATLLGRQNFAAARLARLQAADASLAQAQVNGTLHPPADRALRRLERTLGLLEQRETGWIFALGLFVAAGTQEALSLARWRALHENTLRQQVETWAEFEALVAVATYAAEHDATVFPEFVEAGELSGSSEGRTASFLAEGLQHPLLPPESVVGNDVLLRAVAQFSGDQEIDRPVASAQFLLISGSNMAGKSTLLRGLGLCVVLARTGAPVPAQRVRMSALRLGASIGMADSLADGRSKFLAEVERLRALVQMAKAHPGEALFLMDEILSGTNSADRRIATEAIVRGLTRAGAIGALSTHDLTLTEIADQASLHGRNVHMASAETDDPLRFDYLLKPGPNRRTNGLAIVRLLGLID